MKTLHGSVMNTAAPEDLDELLRPGSHDVADVERFFRFSLDVRFQPASDAIDPRYSVNGQDHAPPGTREPYPDDAPRGGMGGALIVEAVPTLEDPDELKRNMYQARKDWGILPPE